METHELFNLCVQRGIHLPPNCPRRVMTRKLSSYDRDQAFIDLLRPVAAKLDITVPEGVSRDELVKLIEPHAVNRLTAGGYYVPGQRGRSYVGAGFSWELTGQHRVVAGRIELQSERLKASPQHPVKIAYTRAFTLYLSLLEPDIDHRIGGLPGGF